MGRRGRIAFTIVATFAVATSAVATAGTWPKLERNAADQALAKKSVLHVTDFTPGSGWKATPAGLSGTSSDPACNGPAFSEVGHVTTGSASTSFKAPGIQVWSSADVMQTLAMAREDVKQASGPALMNCARASLEKELPPSVHFVSLKRLAFPPVGDWSTAYRALVDVAVSGTKVRLQMDIVLVLNNRVEITLMQMAPFAISSGAKAAEERMIERLTLSSLAA